MVRWRALGKRLLVWVVAAAVVAAAAGLVYAAPLPTEDGRVDAVREAPDLTVEERDGGYVLADADPGGDRVGLVFYPGARVDPAAYLPVLAGLVEQTDVRVYVPRMPVGFAVLDPGRAGDARTAEDVTVRYVGGHSLGGAMACRYAGGNADEVDGVVLLGAYCADDVSGTDLDVLTVTGERDAVVDRGRLDASRERVPGDARFVELAGFNHSSFGAYHGQPGDRPATVSDAEAERELTRVLAGWFANRSGAAG